VERRLAAILVADVAGYSRLMEADEEGTFRRLRTELNDLFEPNISEHHGRLIKTTGDGLLAEFQSVVEAVRCAIAVQRGAKDRNTAVPEIQRIKFRIGINLGDTIVEDGGVYGDGVNVAARLEGFAEAGGVLLAGTAYDQIKKKIDVGFAFLGEQRVKNILEPVRVYRVLMDPRTPGGLLASPGNQLEDGDGWPLQPRLCQSSSVSGRGCTRARLRSRHFPPRICRCRTSPRSPCCHSPT